jgi:hypothetical protein
MSDAQQIGSRDIEVTVGDRMYILNFGTNAACRFEEIVKDGKSWGDAIQVLSSQPFPSVTLIRQFVKASLAHPADLSMEDVGTFIDNVGGWAMVLRWLKADEKGQEPTMPPVEETITAPSEPLVVEPEPEPVSV